MNINPTIERKFQAAPRLITQAYPSCITTITEYDLSTTTEVFYSTHFTTATAKPVFHTLTSYSTEFSSVYNTHTNLKTLTYTETIGTETCVCTYTVCSSCITQTSTIVETVAVTSVITEYETYTPQSTQTVVVVTVEVFSIDTTVSGFVTVTDSVYTSTAVCCETNTCCLC